MLGLAATAETFVPVVFGVKWLPAVPLLRILCIAGFFWPLHQINLSVLTAQGYSHLFFRLEVIKKVVGIPFIAVSCIFGVMGIAWGTAALGVVGFGINAYYTQRHLGYGAMAQLRDFFPIVAAAIPMALGVYLIGHFWHPSPIVKLASQVTIGVACFTVIAWSLRLSAFRDAMGLLKRPKGVGI
jgi:O-antigen/teichoic acid export membrane protein